MRSPRAPARLACARLLLLHGIEQLVGYTDVLDGRPADVALGQLPETLARGVGLVHFAKSDVHEVIAVDEVAVERFAIFELNKLTPVVEEVKQIHEY